MATRAERIAPPIGSDVNLLGDLNRVVDFDAEISDRAFDLGMAKQELDCTEVAGSPIDQSGLRSSKRMRAILQWIETNAFKPLAKEPAILTGREMSESVTSPWKQVEAQFGTAPPTS